MRNCRWSGTLGALLLASACGGDSPVAPGAGDDGGESVERTIKAQPSFAQDINEIFQRRGCANSGCHGTGAAGLTLTASATANHAALVGVQAAAEDFPLVAPNDAMNSYLLIRIEGRQSVGQRMPIGSSALDAIDQANIRNWIDNGAEAN